MNCSHIDELLGAYALGAVSYDDADIIREHMTACRRHDSDLEELRSTARRIAAAAEQVPPPSSLRSRVVAAIDAEPDAGRASPARLGPAAHRTIRLSRPLTWGLGAVAAAVIVGLLAWNVALLQGRDDSLQRLSTRTHLVVSLHSDGANGAGSVIYFPDEKQALVVGDGLKQLESNASTYQLWEVADGQAKSIGLMRADASGQAVIVVPFEGQLGHTLVITIEPAGGSAQPTSKPILSAGL
ncbi:MAG: anti-sigma factor [Chloroflexota bacterium]|nr:anti-sigma factor [Chloroflexota bacterium]